MTVLIGDIHGDFGFYKSVTMKHDETIQIGDFGIMGMLPVESRFVQGVQASGGHHFIRGNHDDPEACKLYSGYIEDGYVSPDGVMFIGGAWSIDQAYRTEGVDWWAEEELSLDELADMIEIYEQCKPRIMITHDCPADICTSMFGLDPIMSRTQTALRQMRKIHQPERWYFGHWHLSKTLDFEGTAFRCLGINETVDVDLTK